MDLYYRVENIIYSTVFYSKPRSYYLEAGWYIPIIQEFWGHKDLQTTIIYTRVLNCDTKTLRSPLEELQG